MSKVRVAAFSVSLDGFGAGPRQDLQNPLGVRGLELHGWFFTTDAFKKMHGQGDGTKGIDNDVAEQSFVNVGAWILGRNMFGPVRGPWNDRPGDSWKGWWGDNPPYHTPVFVLTHHPRPALAMEGGTTFHFVTDGAESALNKAREAARGKDVRIGGGVSTIRQYLTAGQIDEMHLAVSPVLLGEGEHLFSGVNLATLGFVPYKTLAGENANHVFVRNQKKLHKPPGTWCGNTRFVDSLGMTGYDGIPRLWIREPQPNGSVESHSCAKSAQEWGTRFSLFWRIRKR